MTTRAQRLRTVKAQQTRRFGPDHPYVRGIGRRLALAKLATWLESARLDTWPQDDYDAVLRLVTFARDRGRAPRVTEREAPSEGVTGGCDPYRPKEITQARRGVWRLWPQRSHVFARKERITPDHTPERTRR